MQRSSLSTRGAVHTCSCTLIHTSSPVPHNLLTSLPHSTSTFPSPTRSPRPRMSPGPEGVAEIAVPPRSPRPRVLNIARPVPVTAAPPTPGSLPAPVPLLHSVPTSLGPLGPAIDSPGTSKGDGSKTGVGSGGPGVGGARTSTLAAAYQRAWSGATNV
eukprot:m.145235 g.145235  ORF g.145235 m.145235 type:complete len:158 (+) comp15022_c0_seq7:144-617(+)